MTTRPTYFNPLSGGVAPVSPTPSLEQARLVGSDFLGDVNVQADQYVNFGRVAADAIQQFLRIGKNTTDFVLDIESADIGGAGEWPIRLKTTDDFTAIILRTEGNSDIFFQTASQTRAVVRRTGELIAGSSNPQEGGVRIESRYDQDGFTCMAHVNRQNSGFSSAGMVVNAGGSNAVRGILFANSPNYSVVGNPYTASQVVLMSGLWVDNGLYLLSMNNVSPTAGIYFGTARIRAGYITTGQEWILGTATAPVGTERLRVQGGARVEGAFEHTGSTFGALTATPATQAAKINDPAGGLTVDAEARTAINSIIDVLERFGFSSAT